MMRSVLYKAQAGIKAAYIGSGGCSRCARARSVGSSNISSSLSYAAAHLQMYLRLSSSALNSSDSGARSTSLGPRSTSGSDVALALGRRERTTAQGPKCFRLQKTCSHIASMA
eukprot:9731938-Alexandrium_andersonii.AAC.1